MKYAHALQFLVFLFATLFFLSPVRAAVNQTAAWDPHPQAQQLTAIELEWWTSIDPTRVMQSVAGDQSIATQAVNGNIGDQVFVRARACADQNCSTWTADVSATIRPSGIMRLRITFEGVIEVEPVP